MTRSPTSKHLGFAGWLAGLAAKEQRGRLAALRRGLMLDEEHLFELYGHLPPNFLAGLASGDERLYLMVAALFAYHPASFPPAAPEDRRRNLGESLRLLAGARHQPSGQAGEQEEELPESLKRRFEALLAAPRDELYGHLRQVVGLLKTAEIPVDWAQLLNHLQAWEWDGHPVQWEWSRSFYVGHQVKGGDDTDVS